MGRLLRIVGKNQEAPWFRMHFGPLHGPGQKSASGHVSAHRALQRAMPGMGVTYAKSLYIICVKKFL